MTCCISSTLPLEEDRHCRPLDPKGVKGVHTRKIFGTMLLAGMRPLNLHKHYNYCNWTNDNKSAVFLLGC